MADLRTTTSVGIGNKGSPTPDAMGCGRTDPKRRRGFIGLLQPTWKVLKKIMDRRLKVVEFHDCLHGFRFKRGTCTATSEVKLA